MSSRLSDEDNPQGRAGPGGDQQHDEPSPTPTAPEAVMLPAMLSHQAHSWHTLMDLGNMSNHGWALIGGELVRLLRIERGFEPLRVTDDLDAIVSVSPTPSKLQPFTAALKELGPARRGALPGTGAVGAAVGLQPARHGLYEEDRHGQGGTIREQWGPGAGEGTEVKPSLHPGRTCPKETRHHPRSAPDNHINPPALATRLH